MRQVFKDCNYGEQAENQIRDQVVQQGKSHESRKKLLGKGEKLTLGLLLSTAANHERVQSQLENMAGRKGVNLVRDKQEDKGKEPVIRACYRCGKVGHFGRDSECPAKGKTCHKCGGADHFGSQCRTKQPNLPKRNSVRYVGSGRDEDEYAFTVSSATSPEKIDVIVGGVVVAMLIDSGASTNVIDKHLWSKLKQDKIKRVSRKSDKKLYVYGRKQPLNILGTFSAPARVVGKKPKLNLLLLMVKVRHCLVEKLPYS